MTELDTTRLLPRHRQRTRRLTLRACPGCGRKTAAARCPNCADPSPTYDHTHQQRRAALLPNAYGQPCPICHDTMAAGQPLDLDHTTGSMTHATCNRREGAAITNRGAAA